VSRILFAALGLTFAVWTTACESPPEGDLEVATEEVAESAVQSDPASFSGARAFEHLQHLARIGPRQTGSRGAARARSYLKRQLESAGAQVQTLRVLVPVPGAEEALARGSEPRFEEAVHLLAVLPGESSDRFVLAAAYDTRDLAGIEFVGANASASGPALLVELARALSKRPRRYTVAIALLDGDRLPASTPGLGFPGSRALADRLKRDPAWGFDRVRLAVFFQQVGDIDLSIARDLRSHHVYREFFWEAAGVLDRGSYFPPEASVESVESGHLEFIEAGLPRTVLISDSRFGGSDVPGRYAASEKDTALRCSPHSLEVVGEVTLEALDRISVRLARIDRFREDPLEDPLLDEQKGEQEGPETGTPTGQPD
jgi:Zn-dependent M28 family amino/carboxypeptidase